MIRTRDHSDYLNSEMDELTIDEKEADIKTEQGLIQKKLDEIPGGDPFDRTKGVYKPICYLQAMNFQQIAIPELSKDLRGWALVAIALCATPQLGSVDLTRFYSDTGCAPPAS